jgi:Domain of unknown function (DUF1330)
MTVYLIADVTDDEWVPSYAASVHDIVHKHGGKYLSRSGNVKTLEGKPRRQRAVKLGLGHGQRSSIIVRWLRIVFYPILPRLPASRPAVRVLRFEPIGPNGNFINTTLRQLGAQFGPSAHGGCEKWN